MFLPKVFNSHIVFHVSMYSQAKNRTKLYKKKFLWQYFSSVKDYWFRKPSNNRKHFTFCKWVFSLCQNSLFCPLFTYLQYALIQTFSLVQFTWTTKCVRRSIFHNKECWIYTTHTHKEHSITYTMMYHLPAIIMFLCCKTFIVYTISNARQ